MGRVSLTEAYDDRSVIAKLNEMDKRVTENTTVVTSAEASAKASAQAAQETADRFAGSVGAVVQNANAQINASKAQVDQAKAEVDEAVTTVAGYDTRLTTAEGDIDALQGVQADYVKKAGAAQTVTSQIMVPTTATGARDTQIANGTRIQNDLDNYAGMIRTTGNQTKSGFLYLKNSPMLQAPNYAGYAILNQNIESWDTTPPEVTERQRVFQISDKTNSQYIFRLNVDITNTGEVRLNYERRQIVNGVNKYDSGYLI